MVTGSSTEREKGNILHVNVEEHVTNKTWAAVASMPPKQEKLTKHCDVLQLLIQIQVMQDQVH